MNDISCIRAELKQVMYFLGALSSSLEQFYGKGANGTAFLAGKKLAKSYTVGEKVDKIDVLEAIDVSKKILKSNGFLWQLEIWKKKSDPDYIYYDKDGNTCVKIVFRDCMIRQALFNYGHEQKCSLCYIMYGFFSGLTENILGKKSELRVIHSGPNSCLKELIIKG
jgi:predicted hydrocarbon binding protein